MGILQIENRTENWKTSRYFAPLFGEKAIHLAERLGEDGVRLELFWTGMRDYINEPPDGSSAPTPQDLAERYRHLFPHLREHIEQFGEFADLQDDNYRVSEDRQVQRLYTNLRNTEIDIVLETPTRLFVGEAKHEASLGASGNDILVHQLIRQHVMAKILVDISRSQKEVSHFLVVDCDKLESMKNTAQVKFMIHQQWLGKENVLTWGDIKKLAEDS